ncbi:hypothetical protein T484DRAFT_1789942 [Baffinella frigidus]|nr:hypothetical protein T484DRAFT_1789942 [Cryptophyta sp. CCMP2293]
MPAVGCKDGSEIRLQHDFPDDTLKFFEENNVSWKQIKVAGNMEPFLTSDEDVLRQALTEEPFLTSDEDVLRQALTQVLAATAQRPLLIHCTKEDKTPDDACVDTLRAYRQRVLRCV